MTALHETAERAARIIAQNGFQPATWELLPTKIVMAMTEIDEAAYAQSDDELAEELADVAIRILVMLQDVWGSDWSDRISGRAVKPRSVAKDMRSFPEAIFPTFSRLCSAVQHWRHERQKDTEQCLELALLDLWRLADQLLIDLDTAVDMKLNKNANRMHLHGARRAEA